MAKTAAAPSAPAAATEGQPAAPKGGKKKWLVAVIVGVLAVAGGAVTPMFAHFGAQAAPAEQEGGLVNVKHDPKTAIIPFDSVVVNVADGRYTRYLRVKVCLVVDARDEETIKSALEKEKPFLQTWALGYLQDRTMEQLHGSAGMNRVRREVRAEFNQRLFPDGPEKIKDVLLPEYNFQ